MASSTISRRGVGRPAPPTSPSTSTASSGSPRREAQAEPEEDAIWGRGGGKLARLLSGRQSPQWSLCIVFALYKSLILLIAAAAPGPGYDTSTQLSGFPELGLLGRLVRWDAIWFTGLAQQGYKWEQGWAFGWGYMQLLAFGQSIWPDESYDATVHREAVVGVVVSHASHLFGTLLLYRISLIVFRGHERGERIAFVAALLHVLTPAGIFMSAPYIEAPFSLLQFAAMFIYASAHIHHVDEDGIPWLRDLQIVLSGAIVGLSCMFRSNGLFAGAIFFWDAVEDGLRFLRYGGGYYDLQNLAATGLAGVLVGAGYAFPQYLAWLRYCTDNNTIEERPWCNKFPPSIFSYVQERYWYVGLFRYWSPNSIPLFAMAAPMLIITSASCWWAYKIYRNPPRSMPVPEQRQLLAGGASSSRSSGMHSQESSPRRGSVTIDYNLLARFAIPQLLIAAVCFFIANVQIITRNASGYVVWYWWLANWIVDNASADDVGTGPKSRWPGIIVQFCVMYGLIQAGLFAEFLPPA